MNVATTRHLKQVTLTTNWAMNYKKHLTLESGSYVVAKHLVKPSLI